MQELTKQDVYGKRCIVRVDYNSSFENRGLKSDFRIQKTLPLIDWLIENNAKIILITHIEENNGNTPRLDIFFDFFKKLLPEKIKNNIYYEPSEGAKILTEKAKKNIFEMKEKQIILLDNLRLNEKEEENDTVFSKEIASLGEIFINEAFSASHRKHSSIYGIPQFLPSFPGFNFCSEIKNLSRLLNPNHPFTVVIGGQKVITKEKVIDKFLNKADFLILGGLMAAEFIFAEGFNIGKTSAHKESVELIKNRFLNNPKIIIPDKFIVLRGENKVEVEKNEILKNDIIYDISPSFFDFHKEKIEKTSMILWNGPMGYTEGGFLEGTNKLNRVFSNSSAEIIAGGGETVDFIHKFGYENKFSFISTGGGAMLEFLAEETLAGIEALENADKNIHK